MRVKRKNFGEIFSAYDVLYFIWLGKPCQVTSDEKEIDQVLVANSHIDDEGVKVFVEQVSGSVGHEAVVSVWQRGQIVAGFHAENDWSLLQLVLIGVQVLQNFFDDLLLVPTHTCVSGECAQSFCVLKGFNRVKDFGLANVISHSLD